MSRHLSTPVIVTPAPGDWLHARIRREVSDLNERGTTGSPERPRVTVKYAQTLDGRIATSTGSSRWISGPESRGLAHALRAEHDAVMVGVGTVLADDPQLTVRLVDGRDPLRVVLDSRLRIPPASQLLAREPNATLIATTYRAPRDRCAALRAAGARIATFPEHGGRLDLCAVLHHLSASGIQSLLVEGGAQVITSLLQLRCVDHIVIFIAPKVIGKGVEAVGDLGIGTMDSAITFTEQSLSRSGQDLVFRGRVHWPET